MGKVSIFFMTKLKCHFLLKALCRLRWDIPLGQGTYVCSWLCPQMCGSRKVIFPFWYPAK